GTQANLALPMTTDFKANLRNFSDAELLACFRRARWGSLEASTIGWEIHRRRNPTVRLTH
uniref:hypothetical protein n=2 Tax=unclassified Sphingomonas TaxID=196159 RepID=UPI00226B6C88